MRKNDIKVLWRHPQIRDYRVPFFDLICQKYDVHFLFTRSSQWDARYKHTIFCSNDAIPLWLDLRSLRKLLSVLIKADYEIFVSSFVSSAATLISIIVAKSRGKKIVIWEERWKDKASLVHKMRNLLVKLFFIPPVNAFFVCGNCQKEYLKSIGVKESKIFLAHEASIDFSRIEFQKKELELSLKDKKIILYIGRIVGWKGLAYLLRAFSYIEKYQKDVFLLIVGDGALKYKFMDMAAKLSLLNYRFLGQIKDLETKSSIYSLAHVVVVPSIISSDGMEGGPIVVPEALSSGTPVVATNAIGSTLELIEDGYNGYVIEQRDSRQLADKITSVIFNPNYRSMCAAARLVYERKCNYHLMSSVFSNCIDSV